ncbi:GNAT family N-acetyltransferase [Tolypothrix sp. FACHB-123]|uniref:GNAT family N-acetyltransferase n=1 Tax=Tolypothrix sp. FACHB-123 TaxID=2692868 RepID=UPI001683B51E|nr:N-acetyltransferase [Tolypothrix sp. FACHB-123]MBD2359273.1 GNAT family N-acetyltransferase [Tolypothrix sp. FACHB-123]
MHLPATQQTKNGIKVELDYMHPQEQEVVRALLNLVILEGKTYPQKQPLSPAEFAAYWLNQDAFVVRAVEPGTTHKPKDILGAFYLKPNFPGRCSHICNAGFIVQPEARGQGIGRLMGESMLAMSGDKAQNAYAAQLGYEAVMFNLVFETNIPSINLWQTLGFERIGRIPQAAKLADGQAVGALMMYRTLS